MSEENTTETAQNNTEGGEGKETQQDQEGVKLDEGKTVLTSEESQEQKLEKAPDVYEEFKVPEGLELDKDMLGKFSDLAKGINLSQDNAQKLVDLVSDHTKSMIDKENTEFMKVRDEWLDSLKKDPDFGGVKFNETIERAKRTVNKFGSKDLLKFLDDTGYGDNSELLKLFARVDKAVGEDKLVNGQPSGTKKNAAEVMYPNQGKE